MMWFALSLLCMAGAWFFWKWGDAAVARRHQAPPAPVTQRAARAGSTTVTPVSTAIQLLSAASPNRAATNTSPLAFRLSNTTRPYRELLRDDHAILLENAVVDTAQGDALSIPSHLRALAEPGAYIVQSRHELDKAFRAALRSAGATIISYIPNNAYLVRASAAAAAQLAANPQTQYVLPYEPYYKVRSTLLPLAVNEAVLPDDTLLSLVLFADTAADTTKAVRNLGAQIIAEDRSPFGPVLRVKPQADSLVALAGLSGVQTVELAHARVRANDISRVRIGVTTNTLITTSNYLNLTGAGILVSVTDEGVDAGYTDLADRVLGDRPQSLQDVSGHGTHVATTIAGSGAASTTVPSTPPGSVTNADFRGRAPLARIFSTLYTGTNAANTPFLPDAYLQEIVSRTNAFIANNSWGYANDNTYSISAASYDAAVRDAQPGTTGSQPLVYVFAAGNGGASFTEDGLGGDAGSVIAPGTAKNVITVGALEQLRNITNAIISNCVTNTITETNGSIVTNITTVVCQTNRPFAASTDSDTQVAFFSSRGNVGIGVEGDFGRFKPDVVAPGTMVISGRSRQWNQAAYYDPTTVTVNTLSSIVIQQYSNFLNTVFIPANAVRVQIRVFANAASPTPFPPTPIFVRQPAPPTPTSPVGTNVFNLPGNLPLTPVGTTWYYRVVNVSTQELNLDIVTIITTLDENSEAKVVLKELNDALEPNYRYESGTSMAAAEVSGTLALMQQFFEQGLGVSVSPALLKASLINGARPAGPKYDFQVDNSINYQGWGAINLMSSLPDGMTNGILHGGSSRGAASVQFFDQSPLSSLATGQSQTRKIRVSPDGTLLPLRVTLVWTDPPGNPAAGTKLVNDLDLIVTNLDSGGVYYGNAFLPGSNFVSPWDTNVVATADVVNNVENVFIPPDLGTNYSVTVRARRVNVNAVTANLDDTVQDYALIVSCGAGEDPAALTFDPDDALMSSVTPVTLVTNTFESAEAAGFLLGNQLVGANTPLLGTTNGITNQWHFYIVTNTTSFTNAAFVTFLPPTLSIPRIGVHERDVDNATRVQADIDLYVSTDPALLSLDPGAIAVAAKSTGRSGTEQVILSNSAQNVVYFIGVKAEDQMAAEYAFFGVFSLFPFDDANGSVRCFPAPANIPDRSPANLSGTGAAALIVCPCALEGQTRRVVVTNTITHENLGDLVGNVAHNSRFTVLNNHRPAPDVPASPGPYNFIYEDNQEYVDVPPGYGLLSSDGPGSLRDFVGEERLGPWIFTFIDDSFTQTGAVNRASLLVEKSDVDNNSTDRTIAPNTFAFDFIDVPADATNLSVCIAGNSAPVELYLRRGGFPSRNVYDFYLVVPAGGGCLNVSAQDLPPLAMGRYFIGVFNPNATAQTLRIVATVTRAPGSVDSLKFATTDEIPIIDDGVTYASLFNPNFGRVGEIKVGLRIDHPRISDLAITLISPRGTRVLLTENRGRTTSLGYGSSISITNIAPASSAGGPAASTNVIDTGTTEGFITVDYNFYGVPDRLTAYYDGARIFDSGYVSGSGTFVIRYGPGFSTTVTLVMNEGGNPSPSTIWDYVASAIQRLHNYVIFTEDTELTTTPIKFAQPPFVSPGTATNYVISDFDGGGIGFYAAPIVLDGWNVLTNSVEVLNKPPELVNAGPNSAAMHAGQMRRMLTTKPGKTYGLSYAYRRNSFFDDIISWWPAENSLEDVVDGNDGLAPAATTYNFGEVGRTFVFDGDRDGIIIGNAPNLQLQNFSIEGWIRRTSSSVLSFNGNGNATLFAMGTTGGYNFYIRADNQLALGKSQVNEVSGGAFITGTNWHHVAVTKNNTTIFFYVDGVQIPAPLHISGGYVFNAPGCIGAWVNPFGQLDNSFYGSIDELSIYGRDLTPDEVQAIYLAGSAGKCIPSLPPIVRPQNDASVGFSTISNPSGVWSYGYTTNLGGPLTLHLNKGNNGGFDYWRTDTLFQQVPNVIHNPSGVPVTSSTITLTPNQLAFQPGFFGEFGVIRYTCPTNGLFRLLTEFAGADVNGTTTDVHVLRNGTNIFDGTVNGFGPGTGPTFSTNLSLLFGETIDFVVGYGTNKNSTYDATAIVAKLVQINGCQVFPLQVSVPGITNEITGTREWRTNAIVLFATTNQTPLTVGAEVGQSDVLVDSFVITEPPDGLYFQPEESLKALEGEIAFGTWRLEIWDTRVGAIVPQPKLLSWQLDFIYQNVLPVPGRITSGGCTTATVPPGQIRYFTVDVPIFVRASTNRLTAATGPVNVLFNQTIPPTGTNAAPPDYTLIASSTTGSYTLTTNASPAPVLVPGQRYFLGVENPGTNTVAFTLCVDFDLEEIPPFVTLSNGVSYCTANPGPISPFDYYRFVVSSNSVRAQFDLTALSGDMTLLLRQGLPPSLGVFDYLSANPYTNDEAITVFDFSQPVPLTPGDWFFAAVNLTGEPVTYCATATEWPIYGTNIVIIATSATTNSFCLTWTSLPGVLYHVQGRTDLNSTNWVAVSPSIRATGPTTTYCVPLPSPYHFFRVVAGAAVNPYVPPPRFVSITRVSEGYLIVWNGNAAYQYELQWSPTLTAAVWTAFVPPASSATGRFSFLDDGSQTGGLGGTRYYRLRQLP